ncbi:uncharacterized protein [Cherax quadricarinatus]
MGLASLGRIVSEFDLWARCAAGSACPNNSGYCLLLYQHSRQAPDEPDPWLGSGSRKTLGTHQRLRNCASPTEVVTPTNKKCFCHHSLARVALILHLKTANVSTRPLGCRMSAMALQPQGVPGSQELPLQGQHREVRPRGSCQVCHRQCVLSSSSFNIRAHEGLGSSINLASTRTLTCP